MAEAEKLIRFREQLRGAMEKVESADWIEVYRSDAPVNGTIRVRSSCHQQSESVGVPAEMHCLGKEIHGLVREAIQKRIDNLDKAIEAV